MPRKTAILCALPEEFEAIKKVFAFTKLVLAEGHRDTWHASTQDAEYIIGVSNIGCINASLMTTKICLLFRPKILLFCGIAGSICKKLTVGDVVIPDRAFYVESVSHAAFADLWGTPNPDIALHSSQLKMESFSLSDHKIFQATVATSDVFPAPEKSLNACHAKNAMIIDMETYPAAFVAQQFNVSFYCVRSVSNAIDTDVIPENALSIATNNAAMIAKQLIRIVT